MPLPTPLRMDADAFLARATEQEGRYELMGGEFVAMAPERAGRARVKARAYRALEEAIAGAGLCCEAFPDSMAVRVDDATVYEPDASVRCGDPSDDEAVEFADPVVLVDVVSPATRAVGVGAKPADCFRLPSVRHRLILRTDRRTASHHARRADGAIVTAIPTDGAIALDPPGVVFGLAAVFAGPHGSSR